MGARGPKPGFRRRQLEVAQQKAEVASAFSAVPPAAAPPVLLLAGPALTQAQRNNPAKLGGEALRALAHRRGMARSTMAGMSDEKVREQLRYLESRRQEEAA